MADEKNLEEEYFESEIYTLVDEDGKEEEFELIGKYMENGVTYNALVPADESKQNGEYVIFRREEDEMDGHHERGRGFLCETRRAPGRLHPDQQLRRIRRDDLGAYHHGDAGYVPQDAGDPGADPEGAV